MNNFNIPQSQPQLNNPKLIQDMTDRELLAVFVQTLRGCDWIYTIRDDIEAGRDPSKSLVDDDDYMGLLVLWFDLESALEAAATRTASGEASDE